MRLCGVPEREITGEADYKTKFIAFAEILPNLVGNPVYHWAHLELKEIFGITEPLDSNSAERIYEEASEKLKDMRVSTLLKKFDVEWLATKRATAKRSRVYSTDISENKESAI